jgi:hypothetical protein
MYRVVFLFLKSLSYNDDVAVSFDASILEKHTSALKMETVCFSKMMASTCQSTWRQNPDHHHPNCHESIKCLLGLSKVVM